MCIRDSQIWCVNIGEYMVFGSIMSSDYSGMAPVILIPMGFEAGIMSEKKRDDYSIGHTKPHETTHEASSPGCAEIGDTSEGQHAHGMMMMMMMMIVVMMVLLVLLHARPRQVEAAHPSWTGRGCTLFLDGLRLHAHPGQVEETMRKHSSLFMSLYFNQVTTGLMK